MQGAIQVLRFKHHTGIYGGQSKTKANDDILGFCKMSLSDQAYLKTSA